MREPDASWKLLILAAILPILVLVTINTSIADGYHSESFKRFGNALLTSYVVMGMILLGNLFFYADSRNRPLAPLFGMSLAVLLGLLATITLIGLGPMLLESNGSVRAQTVYNIGHTIVSFFAIALASSICIGAMFATLTSGKKRRIFDEEE